MNITELIDLIHPTSIVVGDKINIDVHCDHQMEDVRSACFYAFGQSKITNQNVVFILNGDYLPNIYTVLTEAWFQKTNLIVIALYDSIYKMNTHYLNRCTVTNISFIDKDFDLFKEKIKKSNKKIGPKLYNIFMETKQSKNDYSKIITELNKYMKKEDTIFAFNATDIQSKANLRNISLEYKYGILSKYLAFTLVNKNKSILICDEDTVKIDSNIFNQKNMNERFKIIIVSKEEINIKKWVTSNDIDYIESSNIKDIKKVIQNNHPTVLILKEEM